MSLRPSSGVHPSLDDPLTITDRLRLRNRLVATAHSTGAVYGGIPHQHENDHYAGLSAGGIGMCISGGNVIHHTSTPRRRLVTETWRPEVLPSLTGRAEAIHSGGAAAVLQLLHLGREPLGDSYYTAVAPSAVRSQRSPYVPTAVSDKELDEIVGNFRISASHGAQAGFDGLEVHCAHGYFLGQMLSPNVNRRPGAESTANRVAFVQRILDEVRGAAPGLAVGVRISVGDPEDAGQSIEMISEILTLIEPSIDYINFTAGMALDYLRDMASPRPRLIDVIERLRSLTPLPMLISQGFRDASEMRAVREAGADMIGMVRALIADPELPRKVLSGREDEVRPCVACNEDCHAFDPVVLCTVNPDRGEPGDGQRRAAPLIRRALRPSVGRVAVVGAGPAGLEAAVTLKRVGNADVVLFDSDSVIGGTLRVVATAPNRAGWQRIIDYWDHQLTLTGVQRQLGTEVTPSDLTDFDAVIAATGAEEILPEQAAGAFTVTEALRHRPEQLNGAANLVVVDDGFSWWPHVNAIELGIECGVERITLVTLGTSFAGLVPHEAINNLLRRLRGACRLEMKPLTVLERVDDGEVTLLGITSGERERLTTDAVVVVGERRSRYWPGQDAAEGPGLVVAGDAVSARRASHAVAEGRIAAETVLAGHAIEPGSPPLYLPAPTPAHAGAADS